MPAKLQAVLIADVIESSSRAGLRALLGSKLSEASRRHFRGKLIKLPYSVTAGDEFQTVAAGLPSIPAMILDLRATFRPLSLRIGVGFGRIAGAIRPPVNLLGGEAFQNARKAIERVKHENLFRFETLTAFHSPNDEFNVTINLVYGLHDTLVRRITRKQWEAIRALRDHHTLERTAQRLKLDISTVSRNLKRGYYWQLAETAKAAGALIERAFRE